MKNFLILLLCTSFLAACGPQIVYEEEKALPASGWSYTDSLVATFEIADTNQIYNLHLRLQHGVEFSYQNFYVKVHTIFPQGERLSQQLSLELARSSGAWYGDCNSEQCELDIPIQEGAYFNQAGSYRIVVEQFSRDNPLSEIYTVGFALEETEEQRTQ